MNCPRCGNALPQGATLCPVCGEPQMYQTMPQQGYGYAAPPNAYPQAQQPVQPMQAQQPMQQPMQQQPMQQPMYPPQPQQNYGFTSYPPGYQQPFVYGMPAQPPQNTLLAVISELPHHFLHAFIRPAEVLRGLMEKRDRITCPIVCVLTLLLSFLAGMLVARGFIAALFDGYSTLTGIALAGDSASMNQGVNYIAGRVAPMAGAFALICQAICVLVPAAVFTMYVCVVRKMRFSFDLLLGIITVSSMPAFAAALLAMLLSLASPWLALIPIACAIAIAYAQYGSMTAGALGVQGELFGARVALISITLVITLVLCFLLGGLQLSIIIRRIFALVPGIGSLL